MTLRFTATAAGAAISLAVFLLFGIFRLAETRKRTGMETPSGNVLNAVGFGLFPGIAVWKLFEQSMPSGKGIACFEPLDGIPLITEGGNFTVSRAEMILACLCFAALVIWLILRKEDVPANGDLFLIFLCVWGLIRGFTEFFRQETYLRAGNVNLTQVLMLILADVPLAVWTVRLDTMQKSTAFSVLEWIAVLSCEAVTVLTTGGVLSAGSSIGDTAVIAGCMILCMLLMLPAGMDSRR